jgi:16S rRNA processing protein RimM
MMIKVGQILTTYGHKGEVKIYPLTDNRDRFKKLEYVYLQMPDGFKKYHIQSVRNHNNLVLIKFKEVQDMTSAEKLRGIYLTIEEEQLIDLPEDHYFIFQIIDMDVFENNLYLGKVVDVIQTGSNDVYIVKNQQKEILIPALKSIVKEVDLKQKKMLVSLPEGLLD